MRSAKAVDTHIPSISQIRGRSMTKATWKTMVLKNDATAEMRPLFRAIKKEGQIYGKACKQEADRIKPEAAQGHFIQIPVIADE